MAYALALERKVEASEQKLIELHDQGVEPTDEGYHHLQQDIINTKMKVQKFIDAEQHILKHKDKSLNLMDRFEDCDKGGQFQLDISCAELTDWPDRQVNMFPSIRRIIAYRNFLTEIAPLDAFLYLEVLNLANNKLDNLDQVDFGLLKTLKVVDLSRNSFVCLPYDIVKLPLLEKLLVHRNKIEALPSGMKQLQSLLTINAEYNNLNDIGEELECLPRLYDLNFQHNPNLDTSKLSGRIRRLVEIRALMSDGDERKAMIKRVSNLRRENLNREQFQQFPEINGYGVYTDKGFKNPKYVDMRSLLASKEHQRRLASKRVAAEDKKNVTKPSSPAR